MIDRTSRLSIKRQCAILELPWSTAYYKPFELSEADHALMRRIDELHLAYPFAGSRMLTGMLKQAGHEVGRRHVRTLMRKMGIDAVYRKPNTSRRHEENKVYPYLLRDLAIVRANQVWATDITYIPMRRGFLYLVVVLDWYSRRVLSWRLSNTLTTDFCIEPFLLVNTSPATLSKKTDSRFTLHCFLTLMASRENLRRKCTKL